jgi:hypothetical protein
MNISKGDYTGLIRELQMVRDKKFSELQVESMVSSFKEISWYTACKIVRSITRQPSLPNNLYGCILDRIDSEKYDQNKRAEGNTAWNTNEKCLSPDEFSAGMTCISKIARMDNSCERLTKFSEHSQRAIDENRLLPFLVDTLRLADRELEDNFIEKKEKTIAQIAEVLA